MKIPFGKPIIENKEIQEVCKTLKSSILVHGKKTEEFENLFNRFTGSKFGASVSSCTTGMHLVYKFLGIGSGDEVLVTSQSHVATAHCIEYVGAKPVFIDCELQTGNIDLNKIEEKITKKTKAIAIVHFAGIPVNMNLLNKISKKFKLKIIEDCALALGSKINNKHVGLIGEAGIFSFYPIKHITTIEGGMIISKNKKLIDFVKKNRAFGYKKNTRDKNSLYDVDSLGFNYRMNEIDATIGICQLKKIRKFLKIRKRNFNLFEKKFKDLKNISFLSSHSKALSNSYYCFIILLHGILRGKRLKIVKELKKKGIGTSVYYPGPIPMLAFYKKKYSSLLINFKNANEISQNSIAFPVGPHISNFEVDYIVKNFKDIIGNIK